MQLKYHPHNFRHSTFLTLILYALLLFFSSSFFCSRKVELIFNHSNKSNKYLHIPVFYFTDSKYHLYTMVSIISIISHSTNTSIWYDIYIIVEPQLPNVHRKRMKSLEDKYDRLSICIFNFQREFPSLLRKFANSYSTYYRLYLQDYFPNIHRALIFDSDAFVLKDLDEFYLLDMDNIYYRGCLDVCEGNMSQYKGAFNDHYICCGIMLANFDLIRQDHISEAFDRTILKYGENPKFVDQTILNIAALNKTALLPIKYCEFNHYYLNFELNPEYTLRFYTREDEEKAIKNLTLCHLIRKPWHRSQRHRPYNKEWLELAYQTDFYDLLAEKIGWLEKFWPNKIQKWGLEHNISNLLQRVHVNKQSPKRQRFIGL